MIIRTLQKFFKPAYIKLLVCCFLIEKITHLSTFMYLKPNFAEKTVDKEFFTVDCLSTYRLID
jgi:hypothetical protein